MPAFVVNDIYKKYFRPEASDRTYVRLSYAVTAAVTVASIMFGMVVESVDTATRWIVSGLWAGSAAANVLEMALVAVQQLRILLEMLAGLLVALLLPVLFPSWMLCSRIRTSCLYQDSEGCRTSAHSTRK